MILVDADLRRAQASARLGAEGFAGLAPLIAGQCSLDEALREQPLSGTASGQLMILPAGPPPPNASALISSQAMQDVLRELESQCDLVVIDTPAALAVSDAIPMMRLVSGIVIVARMGRSSGQIIRRLERIVGAAHGTVFGVVATGADTGAGYDYYSTRQSAQNGTNGSNGHGQPRIPRGAQARQ